MDTRVLLAIPYQLSRGPLSLLDRRVVQRLPDDSVPRRAFDRALGSYDQLAGRLLDSPDIVRQGTDRIERSGDLARATVLERDAAAARRRASETGDAGRESARHKRRDAKDRLEHGLDSAAATERRGKHAAAGNARAHAKAADERIDDAAQAKIEQLDSTRDEHKRAADDRRNNARKNASADLHDAADTKRSAKQSRRDADALGDLAEQKKRNRKS